MARINKRESNKGMARPTSRNHQVLAQRCERSSGSLDSSLSVSLRSSFDGERWRKTEHEREYAEKKREAENEG